MAEFKWPPSTAGGGVDGPGSSTDNAVVRWDGANGDAVQNSTAILTDAGALSGLTTIAATDEITAYSGSGTQSIGLGKATMRVSSSGWLSGGTLSVNANPAKFDITSGYGLILDKHTDPLNPTYKLVSWNSSTANTVTNLATWNVTLIGIDSTGAIVQFQATDLNASFRDYILLGSLVHSNHTSISAVSDVTIATGFSIGESLADLTTAIGPINESGNVYSANGANLNINKSAGVAFAYGINAKVDEKNPNRVTIASATAPTFFNSYRNGSGGYTVGTSSTINADQYDDGSGVLATVPNNKWTIKRIYTSTAFTAVEFGQHYYSSQSEALSAIATESHAVNPDLSTFLLRCYLVVKKGATALNDTTTATFIEASRFGGGVSSTRTSSTTTLQQAYDNSTTPEILTDSTRGAVTVKRGSAADTDAIFEGQNNAGSNTFVVTGNGAVTGLTFNKVTITAPATGSTLTLADGKTVTVNNSITFAGTDSTTMTFPTSTDTVVGRGSADTFTGIKTFNNGKLSLAGSTSGNALLNAQAVAGTNTTFVLPTTAGTLVGSGDTGTVTNGMLAGSIAASKLVGTDIATVGTITSGIWNAGAVTASSNIIASGTTDASSTSTGSLQTAGGLGVAKKIYAGDNIVIATSGKGIDFSATSDGSGTMTSELLADYEEGTWTPTFTGSGGSIGATAYTSRSGTYVKIGRMVHVRGAVTMSNLGSWTGKLLLTGLPFTAAASVYPVVDVGYTNAYATSVVSTSGYINGSGSQIIFTHRTAASTASTDTSVTDWSATTEISFSASYQV